MSVRCEINRFAVLLEVIFPHYSHGIKPNVFFLQLYDFRVYVMFIIHKYVHQISQYIYRQSRWEIKSDFFQKIHAFYRSMQLNCCRDVPSTTIPMIPENYVTSNIPRSYRSFIARLRFVLKLEDLKDYRKVKGFANCV